MNSAVMMFIFVALLFLMTTIITGIPLLLVGVVSALLLARIEEWIGEYNEF